ncbi:endonuclease/exonuclease/phosphatase family protein [Marinobacter sp.]|uniref:endonuclease/exonuclease/phosphatase family protein n=1 Tax=Marinobacter sp. TaxID=50741 RepID=UPI00356AC4DD
MKARICRAVLALLAIGLVTATLVPLVHTDQWWIRVFDFPRIQIVCLILAALAGYIALFFWRRLYTWEWALVAATGAAFVWQGSLIAPYTSLYPRQLPVSTEKDDSGRISLLIYNVRFDNDRIDPLLDLIDEKDPDVILLTEPTPWWQDQLKGLTEDYPHTIEKPQDNHYGMLLYSRLELENPEVRFLVEPAVPSIRTQVKLRSGTTVTLYGVHPRPPGLKPPDKGEGTEGSDEREDSDVRDAELMLVAREVKEIGEIPVIVAGDFNDVAWSGTTRLFQRVGGLLDPRIGRGLYNTFDTSNWLFRYPLDYAFASRHFRVAQLERLPDIGSDHFPIFAVFDYAPGAELEEKVPEPDQEDWEEVDESIHEGRTED